MRRPSHAIRRCAGVAVLVSRGVDGERSRRENSHREGSARRRTEAGHGPVRRSQGLDGAARRPRSRGSTQDPSGWFGSSAVADANDHRRLIARQSETEPPRTAITRGPPANGTPSLECGRRNAFQWNDEGQKRRDYRRDNERSWRRLACDKVAGPGCPPSVEVTMHVHTVGAAVLASLIALLSPLAPGAGARRGSDGAEGAARRGTHGGADAADVINTARRTSVAAAITQHIMWIERTCPHAGARCQACQLAPVWAGGCGPRPGGAPSRPGACPPLSLMESFSSRTRSCAA